MMWQENINKSSKLINTQKLQMLDLCKIPKEQNPDDMIFPCFLFFLFTTNIKNKPSVTFCTCRHTDWWPVGRESPVWTRGETEWWGWATVCMSDCSRRKNCENKSFSVTHKLSNWLQQYCCHYITEIHVYFSSTKMSNEPTHKSSCSKSENLNQKRQQNTLDFVQTSAHSDINSLNLNVITVLIVKVWSNIMYTGLLWGFYYMAEKENILLC